MFIERNKVLSNELPGSEKSFSLVKVQDPKKKSQTKYQQTKQHFSGLL
jgi:hypothetical protein